MLEALSALIRARASCAERSIGPIPRSGSASSRRAGRRGIAPRFANRYSVEVWHRRYRAACRMVIISPFGLGFAFTVCSLLFIRAPFGKISHAHPGFKHDYVLVSMHANDGQAWV
jgi:hypothetical protein